MTSPSNIEQYNKNSVALSAREKVGDPPLGRLVLHLARRSRRQRQRKSRCMALLSDSRSITLLPTSRLARVSPLLITEVTRSDFASRNNYSFSMLALHNAREQGCSTVAIFLENGRQLVRLIKTADRERFLESQMHLILPFDTRLFVPGMHDLWRRLVNVVFVKRRGRCFELSTVSFPVPIDPDHPETWLPRPIDLWCDGLFKMKHPIFYDKTKHMKDQPIKVAFYERMPSSIKVLSESKPAVSGNFLHGVEIELVALLSRSMRFHAVLIEVENRTEGVTDAVTRGHADVALGTLPHMSHFLRRIDLSQPYALHCFTFLTPEALGDLSWYTLLLPFNSEFWYISIAAFIVSWLALHAVARLQMERSVFMYPVSSLLNTWSMQFVISVSSPPRGWSLRILFGCVWVHCLLLSVAYRASFSAQLARPPPRFAVDSLAQLASAKHLSPLTWALYVRELLESSQDESGEKVGARLQITLLPELDLAEQIARGKTTFFENVHLLRHVRQLWQQHVATRTDGGGFHLHVMQECVATLPVSLGLSRNSALTRRVDKVIRRATEMGLVSKWLHDATSSSPNGHDNGSHKQQQALVNLPKIAGALVALTTGYILGSIALVFELLLFYKFKHKFVRRKLPT